jgi:hypothetical protein
MFQPTFDTTTEEHMGWDQMEFKDVLVTIDAPQQAEEVGPSQLTRAPVWTQLTQPAADGGTPAGRATPAGGGTPDAAGSSQAAMATPSPDQLGPRWSGHLTPGCTTGTRPGLALELLGRRGADAFRCSTTFTIFCINYFHLLVD